MNDFDVLFYPHMKERLLGYCGDYFQRPERYDIEDELPLKDRYANLQLRDTSELRLSHLCPAEEGDASATGMATRSR